MKPAIRTFLDWKIKAAMIAGTYYFSHKLADYDVEKYYGQREKNIILAAGKACDRNWRYDLFQRRLTNQFAQVIAGLCALDNAYASFWNDFIDEYNQLRGEQFGTPMSEMPEKI